MDRVHVEASHRQMNQICFSRVREHNMSYEILFDFIDKKMRMSHIYQPVMLMALLSKGGRCHERDIATELLARDESQIEYYTQITNNMVGRVLRDHQIVERDRASKTYTLLGYDTLSEEQKNTLTNLCQKRLDAFIEAEAEQNNDQRRLSVG
jgi:ATP adenylyltransferase